MSDEYAVGRAKVPGTFHERPYNGFLMDEAAITVRLHEEGGRVDVLCSAGDDELNIRALEAADALCHSFGWERGEVRR